jgi:signal transduction histidine kinase
MKTPPPVNVTSFRRTLLILSTALVGLYVVLILGLLFFFRTEVREQILERDRLLLTHMVAHLWENTVQLGVPEVDLSTLAIESSDLQDVIAVRLFYPVDTPIEHIPNTLVETTLNAEETSALSLNQSLIVFEAKLPLEALFLDAVPGNRAPVARILVPVAMPEFSTTAAIEFWLHAATIATQFERLDRFLLTLGSLFLFGGGALLVAFLRIARKRLQSMASLLAERNASLLEANTRLEKAVRSSAIGSVSSHLFHGLKNPVAGLKSYLQLTAGDEEAVALTNRMQALINETLDVLKTQNSDLPLKLSLQEWSDDLRPRMEQVTTEQDSHLAFACSGEAELPAYKAQLATLILRNLVENAAQVSPPGAAVSLRMAVAQTAAGRDLVITVQDQGPGIPESVRPHLFQPVKSTRDGGSGLGLAISASIAEHLSGTLSLEATSKEGAVFSLTLPIRPS